VPQTNALALESGGEDLDAFVVWANVVFDPRKKHQIFVVSGDGRVDEQGGVVNGQVVFDYFRGRDCVAAKRLASAAEDQALLDEQIDFLENGMPSPRRGVVVDALAFVDSQVVWPPRAHAPFDQQRRTRGIGPEGAACATEGHAVYERQSWDDQKVHNVARKGVERWHLSAAQYFVATQLCPDRQQ
jgi:hypothetical protein